VRDALTKGVRALTTIATGVLGVALATWGVVQLVPRDLQAGVLGDDAPAATSKTEVVRCIKFRGDVDPVAVRGQLHTKVGAPIDAADVATDRGLIEASLVIDGHLDAMVEAAGGQDVVFTVHAGPVYRMGAVRVVGRLAMKYPALAEELTISAGDDVSARAIDRTQERLATWLTVHGVRRSLITHRLDVDRVAKRVDVTYDVEPSPVVVTRK
jgi:outer membrane protein assembly factor BamA